MMTKKTDRQGQYDIGIIGLGAAGLYLANMIAMERGDLSIAIFERNKEGAKKLRLTGNSRCNFTNAKMDSSCYYSNDPGQAWEILQKYSFEKCLAFYSSLGIAYYSRQGYYYPLAGSADSVADVLSKVLKRPKVSLYSNVCIHGVKKEADVFCLSAMDGQTFLCRQVVIATGGRALPASGSRGDAYYWAKKSGLMVYEPFPALVPLRYQNHSLDRLSGCRLKAKISYGDRSDYGEIQFTKGQISGIPVLSLSRCLSKDLAEGRAAALQLDFLHGVQESCLAAICKEAAAGRESLRCLTRGLFPPQLAETICDQIGVDPDQSAALKEAEAFFAAAHSLSVDITETGNYDQSQMTGGGVSLASLDPHMMAKEVTGLYCIGELVDVDGICGGYNLQWAFSSAAACADGLLHFYQRNHGATCKSESIR